MMHYTKLKCSNINNILTAINNKQIKFKCINIIPKWGCACACVRTCVCCMAYLMSVFINFKSNLIWIATVHLIKILLGKQFLGIRITLIVCWWGSFTFTCFPMHHITSHHMSTSWNFKPCMNDEWMNECTA